MQVYENLKQNQEVKVHNKHYLDLALFLLEIPGAEAKALAAIEDAITNTQEVMSLYKD
jgi:hypothetical protein